MEEFPNTSGAEVLLSRQGAVPRANAPRDLCAPMGLAVVTMFSTHGWLLENQVYTTTRKHAVGALKS